MKFKFSKELYTKTALLKAAYSFTERAYIHLDLDESYYYVDIQDKEDPSITLDEFKNELLGQTIRNKVSEETKDLRKLIIARAMASTLIDENPKEEVRSLDGSSEDTILKDWFEANEGTETE